MAERTASYPGRAPVDAYGNGGFRFAGMSHRGSLLCLPTGIYAWEVAAMNDLAVDSFTRVWPEKGPLGFLLLGTGVTQIFPAPEIRKAFIEAGIGLEVMSTGAAARTYNVLLAENRAVGAALIAVP